MPLWRFCKNYRLGCSALPQGASAVRGSIDDSEEYLLGRYRGNSMDTKRARRHVSIHEP